MIGHFYLCIFEWWFEYEFRSKEFSEICAQKSGLSFVKHEVFDENTLNFLKTERKLRTYSHKMLNIWELKQNLH